MNYFLWHTSETLQYYIQYIDTLFGSVEKSTLILIKLQLQNGKHQINLKMVDNQMIQKLIFNE